MYAAVLSQPVQMVRNPSLTLGSWVAYAVQQVKDRIAAWNTALSPPRVANEKQTGDSNAADQPSYVQEADGDASMSQAMQEEWQLPDSNIDASRSEVSCGAFCTMSVLSACLSCGQDDAMHDAHRPVSLAHAGRVACPCDWSEAVLMQADCVWPAQEQQPAELDYAALEPMTMRMRETELSPKPAHITRRDSAGRRRRSESPKIAALKAAIVAAGSSGCARDYVASAARL